MGQKEKREHIKDTAWKGGGPHTHPWRENDECDIPKGRVHGWKSSQKKKQRIGAAGHLHKQPRKAVAKDI